MPAGSRASLGQSRPIRSRAPAACSPSPWIGYVAIGLALYARWLWFDELLSLAASVACLALLPGRARSPSPLSDSWGMALECAAVVYALFAVTSGTRWIAAWSLAMVALTPLTRLRQRPSARVGLGRRHRRPDANRPGNTDALSATTQLLATNVKCFLRPVVSPHGRL